MINEKDKRDLLRELDRKQDLPGDLVNRILEHGVDGFYMIHDAIVSGLLNPRQTIQGIYVMWEYARLSLELRQKLLVIVLNAALSGDLALRSYATRTAVKMAINAQRLDGIAGKTDVSAVPAVAHQAYLMGIDNINREDVETFLRSEGMLSDGEDKTLDTHR